MLSPNMLVLIPWKVQKWLDDNDVLMPSTHNESKSVIAEIFTITIKGRISKNDS